MKKLKSPIQIVLILLGVLIACTPNEKNTDEEADLEAIKEVIDRYLHAVNTNDMELFMTCWAEDARRLEPDYNIIVGKEDIEARFRLLFDNLDMDIAFYGELEFEVDDNLGFFIGNVFSEATPYEGGPVMHFDLKVADIFKRQADGSWKIYMDHTSPNPVWSNDSISKEMLDKQDLSDPML